MAIFKVVQAWLCSSTCAGIWLQLCPAILTILNTLNVFVAMLFLGFQTFSKLHVNMGPVPVHQRT